MLPSMSGSGVESNLSMSTSPPSGFVCVKAFEQVVEVEARRHYGLLKIERIDADPHTRILATRTAGA